MNIFICMGVSGSGKTTLAEALAETHHLDFLEGDTLHPESNVAKMKRGQALDDGDRGPWLVAIGRWIDQMAAEGHCAVVTCSALKKSYRDFLRAGRPYLRFLYIAGDYALIEQRLAHRQGHFFNKNLLASQFQALQVPDATETDVVFVDARLGLEQQLSQLAPLFSSRRP